MATDPQSSAQARRYELGALAIGIAAGVALLGAAFVLADAPRVVGEAELTAAAGELAGEVTRAWDAFAEGSDPLSAFAGERMRWRTGESSPLERGPERPLETAPDTEARFAVFDGLLVVAERLELREGSARDALRVVLDALEGEHDETRGMRARLRAIQLAARVGETQVVLDQWELLSTNADAAVRDEGGDLAVLALAALSAAPAFDAEAGSAARDLVVGAWVRDELALPARWATLERDTSGHLAPVLDPALGALIEAVQGLAAEPDPRLTAWKREALATAAADHLQGLPSAPEAGLAVRVEAEDAFVYTRQGAMCEGVFTLRPQLDDLLNELVPTGTLPADFALDLFGDDAHRGASVRPPTTLMGGITFVIRHRDPERFIARAGRNFGILRWTLAGLGLFSLFAGCVSFGGLRRQRRLQAMKVQFMASVSHELRTPVTAILVTTENLVDGRARTPERLARYHGILRSEALRLKRLVEDVLDLSRIERGGGPRITQGAVDLERWAQDVERENRTLVEAAGLAFACDVSLDEREAHTDADALGRAAHNLVENAVRHAKTDCVALSIATRAGALSVTVADRGRGIPAAERARIFEPFHQSGDPSGGSGLGLSIVREIALGLGGRVALKKGLDDSGSAFAIVVPLEPDAPHA